MQVEVEPHNYKNIYYPPGGILMWIIIFLELVTFGMALIAFVISGKNEPIVFHESRLLLNSTFGAINTTFLLASGFFMATATHHFNQGDIKKTSFYFKMTMLGGALFLILKCTEYYIKIESGIIVDTNTFFTYYWFLTGFHLIHVIIGFVILINTNYGITKQNSDMKIEDVEGCAAFWHMCDLIWLLLFPVLYLLY